MIDTPMDGRKNSVSLDFLMPSVALTESPETILHNAMTRLRCADARLFTQFAFLLILGLNLSGCDLRDSDEAILRAEFDIPEQARLIRYEAFPKESGWFGREGLGIDIAFQLDARDYAEYRSRAGMSGQWLSLPIPSEFLHHMAGLERQQTQLRLSHELQGKAMPEAGSVYNPTDEQRLARFVAKLPAMPVQGLFQCRSAGDDILHAPKTVHTRLESDLNDFMLAILDDGRKQVLIKVSTSY